MLGLLRRLLGLSKRDAVRDAMRSSRLPPFDPPMLPDDPAVRQPVNRGPRPTRPSAAVALLEPDK